MKGNETKEEGYQPTIRRGSDRKSKELRHKHLTYSQQATKDLSTESRTATGGSGERGMKIKCPVCGIQGFLQRRGNSFRVQHYIGYRNGKRKYTYHKVPSEIAKKLMEVHGSKSMEVNKPAKRVYWCGGWDLNPRTPTGGDLESPAFDLAPQPPPFQSE